MSWFSEAANESAASGDHWLMFLAVDFDFAGGHVRFWSGIGDLVIDGNTYLGAGDLGSVSMPPDNTTLTAERKTFRLSNVDPSWIAESDLEDSFGRDVTEYFGFLHPETRTLIADPEINWEGRIDSCRRVDGAEPYVEINAEDRHILLEKSDGWRYTHEHQQEFFSGDNGFNLLPSLELKEVFWGGSRVVPGSSLVGTVRQIIGPPGDGF